jgi:hypothetical protein
MTKECGNCKETKPLNEFHKDRTRKDGLTYDCKKCRVERVYVLWHSIPPGVYGIFTIDTNRCIYVGSSSAPYERMKRHFKKYKPAQPFQSSVSKEIYEGTIDKNNLKFCILEEVPVPKGMTLESEEFKTYLTGKEQPWMEKLNPTLNKIAATTIIGNDRKCPSCGLWKPLTEYYSNTHYCKLCYRDAKSQRRRTPEYRAYMKAYREKNRDKINIKQKGYQKKYKAKKKQLNTPNTTISKWI